jgi:hypothetical protein
MEKSCSRPRTIQDEIDALLGVFHGLGRTASRLVSCNLAVGVQCNRQNCLISSRMADNCTESPSATTNAEHDIQRFRLFKIVPPGLLTLGQS